MSALYDTANPLLYGILKSYAKHNKENPTETERILWKFIKKSQLGEPFRRQHIIGDFIADFVCIPAHLIIEVDGGYHQLPEQQADDKERTAWLNNQGYEVLRFTNEEVLFDIDNVIMKIKDKVYETDMRKFFIYLVLSDIKPFPVPFCSL